MSVLKLSKNDIIRKEDKEEKIKLKRSDLYLDTARISGWEQTNRQSLDILNDYNNRINKSEWLDKEDRAKYRSALDSYIETANLLRGINKTFGEGYSDEDEQKWTDSIASMNQAYDSTEKYYSQWIDEKDYKGQREGWFQESNLFDDGYQFGDVTKTVLGSATDLVENIGAGIMGMGEAALDALVTLSPYFAQGQYYANGGGYNLQADKAFDQSIQSTKDWASDFVAKDLFNEQEAAKTIIAEPVKALTGIDAETDSVFGKKSDSLVQSAGQLGGTIGLQALGVPWWLTTGVTSFGGETESALNQGATLDEAAFSGLVSAGAEILTEKISGGISFGGKTLDDVLPKLTATISNKTVRTLADLGFDMLGEGAEEVLSGAMSAIGQKLSYASDKEWSELLSSEEALDSFIGGAVLGLGGSVIGKGVQTMSDNKKASEIYGNGAELVTEALEIDPQNAYAQEMQSKLDKGKSLSGGQINRIVEANENALVFQDKGKMKAAVESRLTELGENGDITQLSEVIVKAQSGEKLTSSERSILVNSKYGRRVSAELNPRSIESGEYASRWAESIGTERINVEAYNRGVAEEGEVPVPQVETASATENTPTKENAVEGKISASVEGANVALEGKVSPPMAKAKMVDNEGNEVEAKVAKIVDVENGEASLELEGGQTVKASDVDFGDSGIGFVYNTATEMVSGVGGFNVDAANVMVRGFSPNGNVQEAVTYVSGFNEAYRYGAMGYPVSALASGNATSKLPVAQREAAYNLGRAYGEGKVAAKQANIDSSKAEKTGQKAKKGKVYFDGSTVGKSLTERQKASLKGLRLVAEAMGVDIHIFESKVGKDGKRQGANGWYDPVKKEIHLDLHAGVDGNGLMLFTASHELTHHIREVAPAKFKVFADALLEEYTKNGVSVDALIEEKLEHLERNGRLEGKTEAEAYDLAYEEVVADAAEAMLVDSNAIEALSKKIHEKDKGLWETIKDFITKLVNRIKAAYEGLNPDSDEGKLVRGMGDSAERLQKLWVDALLEASEANTALSENGIMVNPKTESASLMSVRDILDSNQQQKVSKALAERFDVTQAEAKEWLKAETSLASLILNPKYSQYLDYTGDPNEEAIKSNSDYPQGTVDFSNICKKRRDFTEVMNRVLRNFPNHVFAATDLAKIRTIMEQEGMEVACAICYVEDRRQLDGPVAQDFIDSLAIYREGGKIRPDGKPFNANQLKAFKLIEGDTYTPSIYELISLKGRNSLKAKNPAMEEAWVKFNNARGMQSVRLLLNDAEYKRQILKYSPSVVDRKNDHGGLRIYSFSDMEMFHLIDIIQVITDSATVGLSIQGYTKVNEYAKAVKDTGEKLNRSLIPKGDLGYHMENGRVVLDFDTVEGIDINHPDFFDNIDNPNIGNIIIGINATQIKAAMTSKFIDQIIPFHTGQSGEVLGEKGIATWDNYKDFQSERDAKTKKKSSHQINIYTEVINAAEAEGHPITNKVEFVNKFLEVCRENNLIPRFSDFLNVDENGDYVYTEGYHKFLVDFKTFDQNTGEYLPQMPVKPIFDNEYITKLLTDYVKTQQAKDAEFTKAMPKVLDRITKEIVKPSDNVKYSDRDSLGNELSKEQQEYFKDSKIRDKKGNLMVLYHGTTANFNTFKKGDVGFHFGTKGAARGRVGFGKNVTLKEVYLNITNPIVFDEDLGSWDADFRLTRELHDKGILTQADAESVLFTDDRQYRRTTEAANKKLASVLLEKGYDGIAYSNTFETKNPTTSYIVFNSNQAKEITNNAPTSNPDIRYSDRDSHGNELSKKQKEFFKDSKARDEEGNLLVLYHGTSTEQRITEFKTTEGWRTGLWLSTDHETSVHFARATEYVENDPSDDTRLFTKENSSDGIGRQGVYELYANVKNPLIVDAQSKRYWEIPRPSVMGKGDPVSGEEINAFALENGYDGVIIEYVVEGSNRLGTDVIVFSPNQVKYTDNLNPTESNDIRYSDRDSYAPTFYSHMGKVIDEVKLEKMGTSSILNHLKNRGVKDEEIKWSGIEAFLEGKKSVTKTELQEFVAGSQLQIVEQMSDDEEYTHWSQYKLDGGSNYRELVFQLPNSTYSNNAMRGHWGQDAEGVLAHARMQDFTVDGKKMLFVEEIQSDWHNEGREKGYTTKEYEDAEAVYDKLAEDYANKRRAFNKYVRSSEFRSDPDEVSKKKFDWLRRKMDEAEKRMQAAEKDVEALKEKGMGDVPDAPFKNNYHEYVFKRLLRMAAEEGYDSIGWTTADIQSKRWSEDYAEGYRIEYDQDIPKFLRKYGKKWGATVGYTNIRTTLHDRDYYEERIWEIESEIEQYRDELDDDNTEEYNVFIQEGISDLQNTLSTLYKENRGEKVWSMDLTDSMKDSVLYEGQVFYSDRVTDKKTLDFLENQEHVTVYRAMQVIDGKLYPPMNAYTKDETGKKVLMPPSEIGEWEQAVERPDLIDPKTGKFKLDKGKVDDGKRGTIIPAAYNPYIHTSASPLNDQFSSAYKRSNLVVVEGEIPASELTSGYRAEFAKDTVGETKWHSGPVAGQLKGDKARRVFLSRWFKPVRIVPDSEVASIVAKTLEGENIDVPYNVVTPTLRAELEKVGVPIKYQDRNPDSYSNRSLLAGALETAVQNDIEREKLRQYKQKIDLINSEEQKLHDLREQIKELSFKKGPRDTQAIKNLQFEANQAANRINTYDRQLLNLESTKALKGVLEREKAQARKRDAQKYKEALERYREKSAKTQRELMDRYQESRKRGVESRNKTAMRHKIKDVVNDLNNYLLKGTKDKHVPIELQKAVAEALDAVNMDTVGAEERIAKKRAEMMSAKSPDVVERLAKEIEHIGEMGGNMAAKISRLKTSYDSIINSDDPLVAGAHDEVISNTIDHVMEFVGNTPLRDMSLPQLEAVYDMYRMVLHSVRAANKAFKAKKSEEISVIANRVMEEIDKQGKKKLQSKAGQTISEFNWNNQKPVYAFERIGSDSFTEVFSNVRAGEDTWAVDMTEAQEFREEQVKTYKYDSWDFKKRFGFTSTSGMHFELSLDQIMSLYAYSKRDQAAEHLKRGGIVFDETTEVTVKNKLGIPVKFNPTEATAYNISEETLADIISKLTPDQKAFADAMQDYLSTTMGEKGNEVSLELYGVKLFKEKHYFPLKSATQFMAKAKEQQKGEVKIKNKGFTKETVYKANNPIVLTPFMDVWAGHVNEMSMYHSFTLALEDFYRVYNYKTPTSETMATESVEMFLQNAHGKAATKYIDQLLKDLNGGALSDPRETPSKALMSNFKKASVIASLSVVIQQPSAIVRAQALVDAKYFVGKPSKHKDAWAEVKKYAPVAVIKEMGYFDTGMGKGAVEWLKGDKSFKDKMDDALAKAPSLADELTWVSIWNAVKRETARNNPSMKTSSEEFLRLAGERFTEVIVKTQVYDSVLARSANMRSKSAFMNMLTAFLAEPTTSINMLQDAFKKGDKKQIARTMGAVYGSVVLNSALVAIVYAMRDDDEDETFLEKYLSRFTTEVIDGVNPLTYIPFVKDIWSAAQGFDVERADMTLITKTLDSLQQLIKIAGKDTSDMDDEELAEHNKKVNEAILSITDNLSSLMGLPVKNIRRDINGIINGFNTIKTDIEGGETTAGSLKDNILEAVKDSLPVVGWLPGENKGDKLYDAIIKGDTAYVERLKSGYTSEASYNSAIRNALRENDPRIKEAAEAVIGGKGADYARLVDEMEKEGKFSRKIIAGAIAAEVEKIRNANK